MTDAVEDFAYIANRMKKSRTVLAKVHWQLANIRKDNIHKATSALTNNFETIVLENLNVIGMVKNHNLANALHDASFGEIRRQCEYKAKLRGGHVLIADRYFPSSKTCSACGHKVDKLPLTVREWTCYECGVVHDRDRNAAMNLQNLLIGQALPESLTDYSSGTLREIVALASSQEGVKLWSVN